jgi:hypothetical protein
MVIIRKIQQVHKKRSWRSLEYYQVTLAEETVEIHSNQQADKYRRKKEKPLEGETDFIVEGKIEKIQITQSKRPQVSSRLY